VRDRQGNDQLRIVFRSGRMGLPGTNPADLVGNGHEKVMSHLGKRIQCPAGLVEQYHVPLDSAGHTPQKTPQAVRPCRFALHHAKLIGTSP
jgi:hypothetical protein